MSDNVENIITSVDLTPYEEIVKGELGVSSFIVNDYVINLIENEGSYTLEIIKGSQTQSVTISDPVSIKSVTQVASSHESGGVNTIRVVLSDDTFTDFDIYNGEKGDKGDPGITPAERQDILNAEALRVQAENARVLAEQSRASNEETRVLKEGLRNSAEAERIQQEKNRVSAENSRESAEGNRNSAEQQRVVNETNRNDAETARSSQWVSLKSDVNAAIVQVNDLREDVEELSGQVDSATRDVVESYTNVNNYLAYAQGILGDVEEAASDIENLIVQSSTLEPGNAATVSYSDGTMIFGIPKGEKGDQGDSFHIVKTYSSIAEMELDYLNPEIKEGDFVMITSTVEDPDNAKIYVKGSQYFNFVVDMSGATGIQGPQGIQGVSPDCTVQTITGGHRVVFTGAFIAKQFDVTNGVDGKSVTDISMSIDENGILKYQVTYE